MLIPAYTGGAAALYGGLYDPNAQAWFNACANAGSAVSTTDKGYYNTFILGLKTDGLFSLADRIVVLGAASSTQALIDLATLTAISLVGVETFTSYQGYAGDGNSGSYIDFNINPSAGGFNFTTHSASIGAYNRTSRTGATTAIFGDAGSNRTHVYPFYTDNNCYWCVTATENPKASAVTTGFWNPSRTDSATMNLYRNGSLFDGPNNNAEASLPSGLILGAATHGGSNSTDQLAFGWVGGALTSTQAGNLYTRIQTLGTSLGWAV